MLPPAPAAASSSPSPSRSSIGMINRVLVDNSEITAAINSHMRFNLQPAASSPLPPLGFSPYGLHLPINSTNPAGAGGRGGADLSHTTDQRLQPLPPDPTDGDGSRLGQTRSPSVQRSSSHMWTWTEEGGSRSKGSQGEGDQNVAAVRNKISNNNNSSSTASGCKDSLSVGSMRMKKVKARRKVREPRFCFKTMSEVDVLDDGYKWRKYGQKVVKNTQHPRSYYRCTQDNCRVKKRVERLAEDPRMVITTYEGRHAHSPSPDEDEASAKANFFWL